VSAGDALDAAVRVDVDLDVDGEVGEHHASAVRDIAQVVAEAAPDRQRQELAPLNPRPRPPATPSGRSTTTVSPPYTPSAASVPSIVLNDAVMTVMRRTLPGSPGLGPRFRALRRAVRHRARAFGAAR